ncbi:hypothetical protein TRAPUB_4153 [Trametes pubescens]|uniref:Cation/H+ exchanger transmembrane domain-containing protein n=1 Tax=Trametes pubescens TaxID=154538 RepID=A0A1M2VBX6_TRAPU|nr:hypothetical protein TRAPUB_4153 [Trametes pubescens]
MVSLLVKEKLYINEVVLGTACGVIFGPYCANVFDPRSWGTESNAITLEVMRITLAAGLFAIGVELPQSYLADHAKSLLVMVVPTMAFGWVIVAAVVYVVFPPLNFISSLVIAACLTPTDPIISAAIVGGKFATKHVPLNLRRILSAESAANDGLAYPFLSLSVYLTTETSRRVAIGQWFLVGWLYQVILGTLIGAVLGVAFSHLMKFSHRKGYIDRQSYVAQYLALALFTIGITRTLGSDDLLAAFAAGSAISWDGYFNTQTEDEVFSSVIDLLLNCGCFVYIGAWMPFSLFNAPELGITPWRLVTLFLAVLMLRRIPPLLLLYKWVPEIRTWREAIFSGHFGPMGVGAIFVSTLAVTELPKPHSPPESQAELLSATLQTIVAFVVLGSIIIHGLSIPFFSFGRNVRARTLSLTHTWTLRTGSVGPAVPDWALWARRTPEGSLVRPGTPLDIVTEGDVERGLDTKDVPASVAEPQDALAPAEEDLDVANTHAVGVNAHVSELGPAAMISGSDTAAGPAPVIDREGPPARSTPEILALEEDTAPAEAENAHVTLKPAAAGNGGRAVKLALTPSVPLHGGEVGTSPSSDARVEVQSPTTPSPSPSPTQRSVRFPLPPRLANLSHEAAGRDRAPLAERARAPALTSGKGVHFPEDEGVSAVEVGASVPSTEGVPGGGGGGGGVQQGRDAHFPASQ